MDKNTLGLVELNDSDLRHVTGGLMPALELGGLGMGRGGEIHVAVSGPPLKGELGASYATPAGGKLGGTIIIDGHGWTAGVNGQLTSRSGNTSLSGSAFSDGHDWGVTAAVSLRF